MLRMLSCSGFLLICCALQVHGQSHKDCEQGVIYNVPPPSLAGRMQLHKNASLTGVPTSAKRIATPQGTRWFIEVDPDYRATGPWTTALYMDSGTDRQTILKATFIDHGNTFSAHWINEKLLFVQVWWGRFASSDVIIDVPNGRFLYNEFAHYDDGTQPCRKLNSGPN